MKEHPEERCCGRDPDSGAPTAGFTMKGNYGTVPPDAMPLTETERRQVLRNIEIIGVLRELTAYPD